MILHVTTGTWHSQTNKLQKHFPVSEMRVEVSQGRLPGRDEFYPKGRVKSENRDFPNRKNSQHKDSGQEATWPT